MSQMDLTKIGNDPNRVRSVFGSYIGTCLSDKAPKEAIDLNRERAKELAGLYPDIVKKMGRTYEQYQAIVGETPDKDLEEIEQKRRAEIQASKPQDLIIAEKYVHLFRSATKRNKDFNLSYADVRKLMDRKTCFYTGVKFNEDEEHPYYRTIDRIDPNKGYVKDNVVACSMLANQIKNRLFEEPTSNLSTNVNFMLKMIEKLQKVGFDC